MEKPVSFSLSLNSLAMYTAIVSCGSWIFLGSNGIVLGGIGGFLGLLLLCCCLKLEEREEEKEEEKELTREEEKKVGCLPLTLLAVASMLHLSALALGIIAIDFYITYPVKDWGFSIFHMPPKSKTRTLWILLSVVFSLVNLASGIIDVLMVRRFILRDYVCCCKKQDNEYEEASKMNDVISV
jgi:hypothetical protein